MSLWARCAVHADRDGVVLDAPPLPEAILYDPILGGRKLIAQPGDEALLPRGGDRGFPHWGGWQELSPRFPRDLGRAMHPFPHAGEEHEGAPSIASALATRQPPRPARLQAPSPCRAGRCGVRVLTCPPCLRPPPADALPRAWIAHTVVLRGCRHGQHTLCMQADRQRRPAGGALGRRPPRLTCCGEEAQLRPEHGCRPPAGLGRTPGQPAPC